MRSIAARSQSIVTVRRTGEGGRKSRDPSRLDAVGILQQDNPQKILL